MRVAVMCIGNELLMDEGVGPACARYLQARYAFPADVDVLDRAVMGMAVISDLRAYDFVLVLDAVEVPGAEPGQVFSFAPEDAAPTPPGMTSLHEVRFADVLASAELLGIRCQGHCFGIQVENMSPSEFVVALTPRVAAALPLLAQAAVRYLRGELGLEVMDLLAEGDPLRAGRRVSGARDFSAAGVRTGGCEPDAVELADAPQAVLPAVYGDPDADVMARYLAAGLAAVGAGGAAGPAEGALPAVEVVLPAGDGAAHGRACGLAERFGLVPCVPEPTAGAAASRGASTYAAAAAPASGACDSDAPAADGGPAADGPHADGGILRFTARVSPAITDYDCDALIGACLELIEAAGSAPRT